MILAKVDVTNTTPLKNIFFHCLFFENSTNFTDKSTRFLTTLITTCMQHGDNIRCTETLNIRNTYKSSEVRS